MPTATSRRYTYDDLASLPDDGRRYELIAGALFVTPAPATRHQAVVRALILLLGSHVAEYGGRVYPSPVDVFFSDDTVLEPDVVALAPEHVDRVGEKWIEAPPDLVVEVSSPSTASHDLVRKRRVFEQAGIPEFWYVDLDAEQVFVHRLGDAGYGDPISHGRDDVATSAALSGLEVPVNDLMDAR